LFIRCNEGPIPVGQQRQEDSIGWIASFLIGRDKLHVNDLFWGYTYHAGPGAFTCDDALAVMRKYPSF
jgi:hypothetical protein